MVPVAQANSQTAPKRVYLEVVTTALRKLGRSEESITRSIFQDCGDGSLPYDHTGEALPPGFWRTGLSNVKINASDISNVLILPADAGPWRKPAPPAQEEPAAPAPGPAKKLTREDVDGWLKERLRQRPPPRKRRQKAEWFRVAHEQMKLDFEPVPFGDSDSLRRYFDKAVQQKKI